MTWLCGLGCSISATERRLELVVCAAPLAHHVHKVAARLVAAGWQVNVTTSDNAVSWVDHDAVAAINPPPARRRSGEARPGPPTAVVVVPATFNTLNKLRAGISDTPALGVLNDAVGQRLPLLAVPMISERLIDHPAWSDTLAWLNRLSVTLLDPATGRIGRVEPLASGTGDSIAERFDPGWVLVWADALTLALR